MIKSRKSTYHFFTLLLCLSVFISSVAFAQGVTLTSQGISGDRDKKKRDPVVSVTRVVTEDNVKLLVDAHVQSADFRKYPIRFEFYVNRKLVATQIRSVELPGPIGVIIGPDIAAPPFNYTVIARIMHPNRTFTTVINGAAYANELVATLDCTVTLGTDDSAEMFVANDVGTIQEGNNSFTLAFEAADESKDEKITVSTVVSTTDSTASASLSITRNDTLTVTNVTGELVKNEDGVGIDSVELSSEDGNTSLDCS
jgi:hypothetical protein